MCAHVDSSYDAAYLKYLQIHRITHDVIPAALEQTSCVIVVWSKASVTRKWVRAELEQHRGVHRFAPARDFFRDDIC